MLKPLLLSLFPLTLAAEVSFVFDYSGSAEFTGSGIAADRRAALEEAAAELGAIFEHTETINIEVSSINNPGSDLLASAGSASINVAVDFFGYAPGVVMQKILTGVDDNGAAADGTVEVNFGLPWDLDDSVSGSSFDFQATIIHELLHAMGFLSGIYFDGTDDFNTTPGDPGVWSIFDDFLTNSAGQVLVNDASFALVPARWNAVREGGTTNGIFFSGPQAMAANGGNPVAIYSPSSWEEGSSGSHLDDNDTSLNALLMLAATDTGQYRRSVSRLERAILRDIGYSVVPVADPELEVVSIDGGTNIMLRLSGQQDTQHVIEAADLSASPVWQEAGMTLLGSAMAPSEQVTVSISSFGTEHAFRAREIPTPVVASEALEGAAEPTKRWRR